MVSIIVPVYNVEQYLNECVESALKLNTDIEIILVDDGSTDTSGTLCDVWAEKEPRVRVIHQKNGGLSAARNTGIRISNGEYIMFLDSDDFLDPEETDRMLAQLQPDTDVLMGLYRKFFTDDCHCEPESCDDFLTMEGRTPTEQFLTNIPSDGSGCFMTAWRFVCGKEFLLRHDLLFLPGIYHEDEEWTSRLFCKTDSVTVTHRYFYQYRQAREGGIMSSVKPKHLFDSFEILERMDALRKTVAPYMQDYLQRRMAMLYLNNMIYLNSLNDEERMMALDKLRRFHDVCMDAMTGKIGKAARLCNKVFGLQFTCFALKFARTLLGKR